MAVVGVKTTTLPFCPACGALLDQRLRFDQAGRPTAGMRCVGCHRTWPAFGEYTWRALILAWVEKPSCRS